MKTTLHIDSRETTKQKLAKHDKQKAQAMLRDLGELAKVNNREGKSFLDASRL